MNRFLDDLRQISAPSKKFSAQFHIVLFVAIGQKTVVADSHEPFRQNMKQKSTDKFHRIDGLIVGFAGLSVFIAKTDTAVING